MTNILRVTAGTIFKFCRESPWYHTVSYNNLKSLVKTVLEISIYCLVIKYIIVVLWIKRDMLQTSNY